MSVPFGCKCSERQKPVEQRRWYILQYKFHRSAFNGYKHTTSDYSTVTCTECGSIGRTKAQYVEQLTSTTWEELQSKIKTFKGVKR